MLPWICNNRGKRWTHRSTRKLLIKIAWRELLGEFLLRLGSLVDILRFFPVSPFTMLFHLFYFQFCFSWRSSILLRANYRDPSFSFLNITLTNSGRHMPFIFHIISLIERKTIYRKCMFRANPFRILFIYLD